MSNELAAKFYTPPEAGRLLGCGSDKVLELIRKGELKAANLSSGQQRPRWRISPADLQDLLDRRSNTVQASSSPAPSRKRRMIPVAPKKYV
jgi:excisionase family DNA binding protein